MSSILFASGVLGFLSGILCRSFLLLNWPTIGFVFFLGVLGILATLRYRRRLYVILGVLLITASCGMARVAIVERAPPVSYESRIGTSIEIVGRIVDDPDVRESSQRVVVEGEDGIRVLAVLAKFPEVRLGERVLIAGVLERPEPFDTAGGRVFRYDWYLAKDSIFLMMSEAQVTVMGPRIGLVDSIRGGLTDIKHWFMGGIDAALPEPASSLAAGMLLGGKQGLGKDLLDAFTTAGLVHIVVLSGYNIMIIAEAILRALSFLRRRLALSVSAISILAFVLAAGAGSAALRAGIMAVIALFARATGRTYDVLRALGLALVVMLLYNPLLLAFDPGFQLSVLATLGLILGAPIVEARMTGIRSALLRDVLATTIAAQIFVLPLLLYQTGNLSLVSLLANVLVLPVVPLAMLLSFIAGGVAAVLPMVGPVLGFPAYAVLSYVISVTEFAANLPFAQLVLSTFPFLLVVLLYALLAWGVWRATKRKKSL